MYYFSAKLLITGTNAFISSEFSFSLNGIIFFGVPSAICLIIFSSVVFACQYLSVKSVDSSSFPKSVGFPFLSWQSLQCLMYNFTGSILASLAIVIPEKQATALTTNINDATATILLLYIIVLFIKK